MTHHSFHMPHLPHLHREDAPAAPVELPVHALKEMAGRHYERTNEAPAPAAETPSPASMSDLSGLAAYMSGF